MICAKCGTEHPEGPCPGTDPAGHEMAYVSVLETSDSLLLPVVESVLGGAGIPFVVQGADALGVLPVGIFGSGERMHGLSATVHVPRDRAEEARALLEGVNAPDSPDE